MAGEIEIPLALWPHRQSNQNAVWDVLTATNNNHQISGFRLRDGEIADLDAKLTRPIPSNIHATPNGKVKIRWATSSTSTNSAKFFVKAIDIQYNTTSADPATWDDELTVIDANNGAVIENECEVSLAASTLTSGRGLRLLIRRDATSGETQDTLAADIWVTDALFVADQA
jgi:hypothetical protein